MRKVFLIILVFVFVAIVYWILVSLPHKSPKSFAVVRKQSEQVSALRKKIAVQSAHIATEIKAHKEVAPQQLNSFDLSTREGALGMIELLRSVDQHTRYEIYGRLGGVKDRSLIPILHEHLWDESPFVRQAAAMVLAYFHDASSMQILKDYVASSDLDAWRKAGSKGQLGQEEAEAYFFSLAYAIIGLGEIGDDSAADVVAKMLGQEIELHGMGDVVSQALAKMGPKGLEAIEKSQMKGKDKEKSLAETIGQIRDTRRIKELIGKLENEKGDTEVRSHAAIAMGMMRHDGADANQLRDKGVEDALLAGTKDSDHEVRRASYMSLMEFDAKKHGPLVMASVQTEEDPYVRHQLIIDLGDHGIAESIPILESLLTDPNDDTKYWARNSLKQLTGKKYPIQATLSSVVGAIKREEEAEKEAEMRDREADESLRQRKEYQEKLRKEGKLK